MKRVLAIIMALVMLMSFAACTTDGEDNGGAGTKTYEFTTGYDEAKYNAPGTLPVFKETQTISVVKPDDQFIVDIDTNYQTLMLEEDLNAEFVFTELPSKEYTTKLNLMAAAGGDEFSDAILAPDGGFSDSLVITLADTEVIAPITKYYYNTDISWNLQDAKERLGWDFYPYMTMPDGEIYGLPSINESMNLYNPAKMFVYKPWFDAAGINIRDIHTTEDFKNAMVTVVKGDPNGNGKADEIGLTGTSTGHSWQDWLINPFIYAGGDNYYFVKDGKVDFAYRHEEWREGLRYIKELYDLGVIDPLIFSQDKASYKAALNYEETIVTAVVGAGLNSIAEDDPRRVQYEAIPPLNSSWNDGKPLSNQARTEPKAGMLVSVNAADIENTFRFGDYMTSHKSSMVSAYGQEGIDFTYAKEGDVGMFEGLGYPAYFTRILPVDVIQNSHWCAAGPYVREKKIAAGIMWSGNPLDHAKQAAEAQVIYDGTGPEEDITKLIFTEEENEIVSEVLSNTKTYVDETAAKFIIGQLDLDKDWDAYLAQLERMNLDEALECVQASYERMESVGQ